MASQRLTENQISISIVPRSFRWPQSGTSVAWTTAHHCVNALKHFVRKVDFACAEVEEDRKLSTSAIAGRRSEICEQALKQLLNFGAFETAEKALMESIEALEALGHRDAEQVRMLEMSKQALTDLREGIPATQRMLQERCRVRERGTV